MTLRREVPPPHRRLTRSDLERIEFERKHEQARDAMLRLGVIVGALATAALAIAGIAEFCR